MKNREEDNIIDVPFTEVTPVETEQQQQGEVLNLEDVAYMVMIGRTKEGRTFFRTVGINDLLMIRGLVEYGRDEVQAEIAKQRE